MAGPGLTVIRGECVTFEDEWGKLRADAVAQQRDGEARTRLDGVPGGVGGQDLKSSAEKKKSAIAALEQHIQPDVQTAGKVMDETSEAAAKGFKDWATGAGITEALNGWRTSVSTLQARLSAEKAALSGTNRLFTGTDKHIGHGLSLLKPSDSPQITNPPYPSRVSGY